MKKKWHEIKITVEDDLIDLVGEFLTIKYNKGILLEPEGILKIYLDDIELENGLPDLIKEELEKTGIIAKNIEINELPDTDWLSKWKESFKPIEIGEKIIIKPPWEKYDNKDKIVININPAMAFGTGHHATTSFIIKELQDISAEKNLSTLSVLDIGTGSAILAITAAKLGAKHIVAMDNDPEIYENASENIALNNLSHKIDLKITEINNIKDTFDIILANLDRDTVLKIGDTIIEKTKDNGEILFSGILISQYDEIKAFFSDKNVQIIKMMVDEKEKEWIIIRLQKVIK
jgi:ribosomal protein L11 methyltransferase